MKKGYLRAVIELDVREVQSYMNLHYGDVGVRTMIKNLTFEIVTWWRRHLDSSIIFNHTRYHPALFFE